MKTRLVFILFCLCGIAFSCKEKVQPADTAEIINVNPNEATEEVKLSEIADSVKCIKLETGPECVMGKLHSIIIKRKYIYAWDASQQTVFVFNRNGKFVAKLDKQGRGPDEYLHIGAVFIDEDEEYVDIINSVSDNTSIMRYSNLTFNLLEKQPMPKISANTCRRMGDTYYFATQQIENRVDGNNTNAGILVVKDGKVEGALFDKQIVTHNSSFSPNSESFTINNNNELFVSVMYDNTFYQLDDMNAYPRFTIDFGKHGIDNLIGLKPLGEQIEYIKKINGLASFPVLTVNNTEIMAFSYYFKQENKDRMFRESDFRQYIRLKKNSKIFHTKRIKNDITPFPEKIYLSSYFFQVAHEVWEKDYLVDIILPQYYFSPNGKTQINVEGIGLFSIEDNPIIVLMKLKKELRL